MAVEKYIVSWGAQAAGSGRKRNVTWGGAAAGSKLDESFTKKAFVATIEAESTAEAIRGVKQLYPGEITTTCFSVLESSITTG